MLVAQISVVFYSLSNEQFLKQPFPLKLVDVMVTMKACVLFSEHNFRFILHETMIKTVKCRNGLILQFLNEYRIDFSSILSVMGINYSKSSLTTITFSITL